MAITFPSAPALNQTYSDSDRTWKYNGIGWALVGSNVYTGLITPLPALDIDCGTGNYFTKTINGNSTFTVSNVPANKAYSFVLELTVTSGSVTWFSNVAWPEGGTAPVLSTNKTHIFVFVTDDGGTRWRGSYQRNYTT